MFILFRFLQEIWIERFSPFWFISCMGTGISATLLRRFPFPAEWLVRCSYIFFAIVCLLFIILQIVSVIQFVQSSWHHHGRKHYYWQTFKNMDNSVFWGTYAMGLQTIINNLFEIAVSEAEVSTANRTRLIYTVYILWWYNVSVSMAIAWGITFIIWKGHYIREIGPNDDSPEIKMMRENLQTMLLLPIVTLVVACSGSGIFIMSDLFTKTFGRNIQLMTLVVTMLLWLHVMAFVAIIFGIYAWNLYVNKLPEANKVFSLFLCLGPMGQGAFGILWLTEDIRKYINLYYPVNRITDLEAYITKISVIWSFKIIGLILALTMLAAGFFFTLLCIMSILSYSKSHPHLFKYQKAWWGMSFPLGTMAIGADELYVQFNSYVPLIAFRVISAIYSVACILITVICLFGTAYEVTPKWYSFFAQQNGSDQSINTSEEYDKPTDILSPV